jgi:hypothetical protein
MIKTIFLLIKLFILFCIFQTLSCKSEIAKDSVNTVTSQFDKIGNIVGNNTKDYKNMALSELNKVVQIEYQIIKINRNEDIEVQQTTLNSIGKDRWNCFHVRDDGTNLLFYCQRLPLSALKLLPYLF